VYTCGDWIDVLGTETSSFPSCLYGELISICAGTPPPVGEGDLNGVLGAVPPVVAPDLSSMFTYLPVD